MLSNLLKFARQGIWPSLTGGWYFDLSFSNFTNVFHLYTWIFFLSFPFTLYLVTTISWIVIGSYSGVIVIFFGTIKYISRDLHDTFDNGEQIQKKVTINNDLNRVIAIEQPLEGIEEQELEGSNSFGDEDENANCGDGPPKQTDIWSNNRQESNQDELSVSQCLPESAKNTDMTLAEVYEHIKSIPTKPTVPESSESLPAVKQLPTDDSNVSVARCRSLPNNDVFLDRDSQQLSSSDGELVDLQSLLYYKAADRNIKPEERKKLQPSKKLHSSLPRCQSDNILTNDERIKRKPQSMRLNRNRKPAIRIKRNSPVVTKRPTMEPKTQTRKDEETGMVLTSSQNNSNLDLPESSGHFTNEKILAAGDANNKVTKIDLAASENVLGKSNLPLKKKKKNSHSESPGEVKKYSKNVWLTYSDTTSTEDEEEIGKFLESLRHSRIKNKDHDKKESTSTKENQDRHSSSSSGASYYPSKKDEVQSKKNTKQKPPLTHKGHSLSVDSSSERTRSRAPRRVARTHSFRVRHSSEAGTDAELSRRHRHPAGESSTDPYSESRTLQTMSKAEEKPTKNEKNSLHLATAHTDTSQGAIHSFQDENGQWMTYTFGSETSAAVLEAPSPREFGEISPPRIPPSRARRASSTSLAETAPYGGTDFLVDGQTPEQDERAPRTERMLDFLSATVSSRPRVRLPGHQQLLLDAFQRSIDTGQRIPNGDTSPSSIISQLDIGRRSSTPKAKFLYKWNILPFKSFTVQYDRLALTDLLDKNSHLLESLFSVFLAAAVGMLGLLILSRDLYFDLWSFWFCVVVATAQFSLVRSVQPDSASPTHGHNRIVAYSRPVYFILTGLLVLLFHYLANPDNIPLSGFPFYKFTLFNNASFAVARDFFAVFILILPFVFLFGLLPQLNTFFMYISEQVEIHVFGGTALLSIGSSLFCVGRSLLASLLLFGFVYGALLSKEGSQNILFSVFCGLLVSFSYHLSRQSSSLEVIWGVVREKLFTSSERDGEKKEKNDPAEEADCVSSTYMTAAMKDRLQSDVVLCPVIAVLTFAIHSSTAFTSLQPTISTVLYIFAGSLGVLLHYLLPQLRKNMPWLLFSSPILKSNEYELFEVTEAAKVMWFERMYIALTSFEQNYLYPALIMNELTREASLIAGTYGVVFGSIILMVAGLKVMRHAYCSPERQYMLFSFTILFVKYDAQLYQPSVLISYFVFGILFVKTQELILKLQFWLVYVAPWQITWGSAFHAFAQPFAVPHSAFLAAQALLAALVQAPFSPFLGSALFLSSYARPMKFWERNYKTNRIDHSNTRLVSQIDKAPHSVDSNLNSIFYEHLTYSLQKSLAGDLAMGRWGNVCSGDCFILASDFLNALVHIIEKGNGVTSFQLRGLEFSGTYCQQREVEAINESADLNNACCCCHTKKIPGMLSFNSAFNLRWLAWQVTISNYVLDGYSISNNNATSMLGMFDLRKILTSYIVKSIIYFMIAHDSLDSWLENSAIREAVSPCEVPDYVDIDATFVVTIDDDYDTWLFGVSRDKFFLVYGGWIEYCCEQRGKKTNKEIDCSKGSKLVTLSYAISVLGRRALGTASRNPSSNLDSFMYGLHSLFKGEFYITSPKDEWVFSDMNLLEKVVAPGVRTALKLYQDHFLCPDEYFEHSALFEAISEYIVSMVITHEGDPLWRKAVLSNAESLLALRRVVGDTFDDLYSIITLNRRSLGFNVVKINRECVRGLWAGQQNELVFLRNKNPERGSIQNAKQVLRNMVNSSCDQPIGYPIYVSPLTTSFSCSNPSFTGVVGGPITFDRVRNFFINVVTCLSQSCSGSCNSGGGLNFHGNPDPPAIPLNVRRHVSTSSSINRASQQSRPRVITKAESTASQQGLAEPNLTGSGDSVSKRPASKHHAFPASDDAKRAMTSQSSEPNSLKRASMTTRL